MPDETVLTKQNFINNKTSQQDHEKLRKDLRRLFQQYE